MATNSFYLARALGNLAQYFDITTSHDLSETIALQQVLGVRKAIPINGLRPPPEVTTIIELLLNTSEGVYPINYKINDRDKNLLNKLSEQFGKLSEQFGRNTNANQRNLERILKIYHSGAENDVPSSFRGVAKPFISNMFGGLASTQGNNEASWKKCNIIQINSPYISPSNKYSDLVTVFMNGIPTIEFSRAVPYIDIKFVSTRSPLDASGKLNSLSIYKFLEGAVETANSTQRALALGNSVSGSINGITNPTGLLSVAGMELFSTPQTLINLNSSTDRSARAVPVIDPFRPFLTFKNLTVDVVPSVGLFSYKTAKLEFVLHDRSRLHEIADFVKPDLYGTQDIYIEYGWNHPDSSLKDNPYADLLNFSRVKEKFMIRNVSFAFDDVGQVNINLDLATRGGTDIETETIDRIEESNNSLRKIRELIDIIQQARDIVFRNTNSNNENSSHPTREIRGIQVLESASDLEGNLRLPNDFRENLRLFKNELARISSNGTGARPAAARRLSENLSELFPKGRNDRVSRVTELTNSTTISIRQKLDSIINGSNFNIRNANQNEPPASDPFLPVNKRVPTSDGRSTETILRPWAERAGRTRVVDGADGSRLPDLFGGTYNVSNNRQRYVSLAKLLLHFVAQPLAATGKYTEVQMIFYPFNDCAGFANDLNVGQFVVDIVHFFEKYTRYRTESINRAAKLTIKDFVLFLTTTIIDDPGAAVYGMDSLYDRVQSRGSNEVTLQPRGNSVNFQAAVENRLRNVTPNGEFKLPQLKCFIEALPKKVDGEGIANEPDIEHTILRLHFYDAQATTYRAQSDIINANRNDTLNALGAIPSSPELIGNNTIGVDWSTYYNHVMNLAEQDGLIRQLENTNSYEINGGPKAIKEFLMKTTPFIIYGAQGTALKSAQLTSQQVPDLSTVNLLRSYRGGPFHANGEQPGGLPLSVIPCELSVNSMGCNLIEFAQQFFIDFNTGTTADNIYIVNGISHKLEPGSFTTDIKFVPVDAYGKYNSYMDAVNRASTRLNSLTTALETTSRVRR